MTFVLEQRPTKLPRKCATCGVGTIDGARKYIDLNVSIDRFGRVYICTGCVKDIANLLKLVPEKDLAVANSKYHILLDKHNQALLRIQELHRALDTLRSIDFSDSSPQRNLVSSDEALSGTVEGERHSDREPVESSPSRESGSVPATAELLKFS
jgi:hypothetical protein